LQKQVVKNSWNKMSMNPYIYKELVRLALSFATSSLLLLIEQPKKRRKNIFRYVSQIFSRPVEVIMSYWGSPGGPPSWAASQGPSPVVPLLIMVALGWVICQETLMGWYEQVTEVHETVTDNALLLVLGAGLLLLALAMAGNRSQLVLVPVALVVVLFLIQNIVLTTLLLLAVAYLTGIYYYRADRVRVRWWFRWQVGRRGTQARILHAAAAVCHIFRWQWQLVDPRCAAGCVRALPTRFCTA
jgi:hypothetical protein